MRRSERTADDRTCAGRSGDWYRGDLPILKGEGLPCLSNVRAARYFPAMDEQADTAPRLKLIGHAMVPVHGPFYRMRGDENQDQAVMAKQLVSGELWGKNGRFGLESAAKAYRGPLPDGTEGFEFWASNPQTTPTATRSSGGPLGIPGI